ncbi:hypothetical protein ACFFX0_29715 [Citricoccus parietis]|uniref:Uncharacterized protein n=1 Tax=Citricoccus parietis TaxID=592307 RepID=A0ABV5G866_9MICC
MQGQDDARGRIGNRAMNPTPRTRRMRTSPQQVPVGGEVHGIRLPGRSRAGTAQLLLLALSRIRSRAITLPMTA